jgi:hypothetical protein
MTEGLTETPWAAMVVPTAPTPSPTGAKLTSSEVRETPVTEYLFFFVFFENRKNEFSPLLLDGRRKRQKTEKQKGKKTKNARDQARREVDGRGGEAHARDRPGDEGGAVGEPRRGADVLACRTREEKKQRARERRGRKEKR